MMTPREQELARLNEAVNLIPDGQKSLFVCLTGPTRRTPKG